MITRILASVLGESGASLGGSLLTKAERARSAAEIGRDRYWSRIAGLLPFRPAAPGRREPDRSAAAESQDPARLSAEKRRPVPRPRGWPKNGRKKRSMRRLPSIGG
jgi:hypothetical protein